MGIVESTYVCMWYVGLGSVDREGRGVEGAED